MRICLSLLCVCCWAVVAYAEPEPTPTEKTAQQLVDELKPSVVVITMQGRDGQQQGLGTGFIISTDGLIATNLHVIGEARPIRVQTAEGKELPVTAVHASDRALDLAIVKVDGHDLPALSLADSAATKAGQAVVAIGNPHGLKHSIVQGVISGARDIDGRKMLQLAIPVEPGNSGGPVVDMAGRVVGIMTLKAQLTENLGFAMESNALKPLLEKPNSVPLARWLKIGTLDTQRWTPLFGANWTERGGRITVSGSGGEFGGRALCLASETPRLPYEVAVRVRFTDKSGAAGLVFHADGSHKHYGFYPSAGKLRLSRFDGPSVFQWQVLQEVASEHYREGQWNDLKVRVEPGKLTCSINGHVVIESTDAELTSGRVGLAKFRETAAEFRRFRYGEKLPDTPGGSATDAEIEKAIAALPPLAAVTAVELEVIASGGEAARRVLEQRASELERRAGELRRIAADARTHKVVTTLAQAISKQDDRGQFDLLRAALLLASLDDEELDIEAYEAQCARMVEEIKNSLAAEASEADKLAALQNYLFTEQGYHGSRTEYYHAANSHLHRVIDDREGLPITLSVLYMELGRRLGLTIEGVGLPGHFVVRFVPAKGEPQLIDVFEQGKQLSRDDAAKIASKNAGEDLDEHHLLPATQDEILTRILRNLIGIAQAKNDREALLRYLDAALAMNPEGARERGLRAVLRYDTGRRDAAIADLDWFLEYEPAGIDLEDIRRMKEYFRRSP